MQLFQCPSTGLLPVQLTVGSTDEEENQEPILTLGTLLPLLLINIVNILLLLYFYGKAHWHLYYCRFSPWQQLPTSSPTSFQLTRFFLDSIVSMRSKSGAAKSDSAQSNGLLKHFEDAEMVEFEIRDDETHVNTYRS